ncbi:LacI family DNA-binding transcriptional regulator [Demequina lutea]|uniref:LacI family transcriptional regulator n=1 Tax=Demequina lutea TaxID=431489 RepID=A0A7Y9Z7I7_9MICO|nr:LacI family DNA-binding transcriptional regulator [Demequina lutea]NYI40189.1 LacI family transcriptional regulator [Demequina lutea]
MSNRITLADVAKLAGVHPGTVSRALSGKTENQVNAATVRRVRRAAKQLGYMPNAMARGLRTRSSMTIGVIVPDLMNPIFPPMVRGIDSYLAPRGFSAFVVNTDGKDAAERTLFESLMERQVDGFIVATGHTDHVLMADALARGVLAVMVNREAHGVSFPSVTGDDARGIHEVVAHLSELGHRRILHLAGPRGFSTSEIRESAFQAACSQTGAAGRVVPTSSYSIDAGQSALDVVLDQGVDGFTAVVAANDLLALGAYHSLRMHGLDCPGDISVVGFNDMPFAGDFLPPMTTVRSPHFEMGVEAARLLLEQIASGQSSAVSVKLPVALVVRGSSGPARRRAIS